MLSPRLSPCVQSMCSVPMLSPCAQSMCSAHAQPMISPCVHFSISATLAICTQPLDETPIKRKMAPKAHTKDARARTEASDEDGSDGTDAAAGALMVSQLSLRDTLFNLSLCESPHQPCIPHHRLWARNPLPKLCTTLGLQPGLVPLASVGALAVDSVVASTSR